MASLLQKAARVNLVAMDFVLQVTVVKLVLGALEHGRVLSFELSRGTKVRGEGSELLTAAHIAFFVRLSSDLVRSVPERPLGFYK